MSSEVIVLSDDNVSYCVDVEICDEETASIVAEDGAVPTVLSCVVLEDPPVVEHSNVSSVDVEFCDEETASIFAADGAVPTVLSCVVLEDPPIVEHSNTTAEEDILNATFKVDFSDHEMASKVSADGAVPTGLSCAILEDSPIVEHSNTTAEEDIINATFKVDSSDQETASKVAADGAVPTVLSCVVLEDSPIVEHSNTTAEEDIINATFKVDSSDQETASKVSADGAVPTVLSCVVLEDPPIVEHSNTTAEEDILNATFKVDFSDQVTALKVCADGAVPAVLSCAILEDSPIVEHSNTTAEEDILNATFKVDFSDHEMASNVAADGAVPTVLSCVVLEDPPIVEHSNTTAEKDIINATFKVDSSDQETASKVSADGAVPTVLSCVVLEDSPIVEHSNTNAEEDIINATFKDDSSDQETASKVAADGAVPTVLSCTILEDSPIVEQSNTIAEEDIENATVKVDFSDQVRALKVCADGAVPAVLNCVVLEDAPIVEHSNTNAEEDIKNATVKVDFSDQETASNVSTDDVVPAVLCCTVMADSAAGEHSNTTAEGGGLNGKEQCIVVPKYKAVRFAEESVEKKENEEEKKQNRKRPIVPERKAVRFAEEYVEINDNEEEKKQNRKRPRKTNKTPKQKENDTKNKTDKGFKGFDVINPSSLSNFILERIDPELDLSSVDLTPVKNIKVTPPTPVRPSKRPRDTAQSERTPQKNTHRPEDVKKRARFKEEDPVCHVQKSATTPESTADSCSAPPQKKARKVLKFGKTIKAPIDSASEESESSDDEFEDFRLLREETRQLTDLIEEECEEYVVVGTELVKVQKGMEEGRLEEQGFERMKHENGGVEGVKRLEEQDDERMVGVNEELEDDFDLRAMSPEVEQVNSNEFNWSDDFSSFSGVEETYLRTPGVSFATQDPVEAFTAVWNDDIMKRIVKETNAYAWNHIAPLTEVEGDLPEPVNSWCETTVEEMYVYFSLLIFMSLCVRGVVKDYWTKDLGGMPEFRRVMSRDRFILITRFLHFVDNDIRDPSLTSYERKVKKIAPILNHCNERFAALYVPNKHLSLDESLLLWKGRLSWVQCIRTKAARFGIKSYELCEAQTGYLLRCILYAGKNTTMSPESLHGFKNSTAKVILELMEGYLDAGHCLVMDNWYNQLRLIRYLKGRATDVIGTIKPRLVGIPDDIKYAESYILQRGQQIARHCGDITLIAWKDVRLVTAVSTFHNDVHLPATRAGVSITKPSAIIDYNKYMGGVDRKDQQLSSFLMERKRGSKWYMKVFKRLLNISLLNTYIIFRKNPTAGRFLTHREFRLAVVNGLLARYNDVTSRKGRILIRPNKQCTDDIPNRLVKGVDHFPTQTETKSSDTVHKKQKRCVCCTALGKRSMVTVMCAYCKVPLCIGECWVMYHNKQVLKPLVKKQHDSKQELKPGVKGRPVKHSRGVPNREGTPRKGGKERCQGGRKKPVVKGRPVKHGSSQAGRYVS